LKLNIEEMQENEQSREAKKKLLKHLADEVYCRLGSSPTHGVGVFAIRNIPKGIDPLRSPLPRKELSFKKEELKHLPKGVRKQIKMFCYYDDKEVLIPVVGLNTMDFSIFLNHSKRRISGSRKRATTRR